MLACGHSHLSARARAKSSILCETDDIVRTRRPPWLGIISIESHGLSLCRAQHTLGKTKRVLYTACARARLCTRSGSSRYRARAIEPSERASRAAGIVMQIGDCCCRLCYCCCRCCCCCLLSHTCAHTYERLYAHSRAHTASAIPIIDDERRLNRVSGAPKVHASANIILLEPLGKIDMQRAARDANWCARCVAAEAEVGALRQARTVNTRALH